MDDDEFHKQVRLEFYKSGTQVVRESGLMALKTLITLNSGAFVVLLTFLGNAAAQSQFILPLTAIKAALFCFLGGLALSFLVLAYTYVVSQGTSPYPVEPRKTDGWFVPVAVILTAGAFLCFVIGVGIVVWNVKPA